MKKSVSEVIDRRRFNKGREPLAEGVQSVKFSLRVTPDQRRKIDMIGGAAWVRKQIDRARV